MNARVLRSSGQSHTSWDVGHQVYRYTDNAITGKQLYNQRNHRQTLKSLMGFLTQVRAIRLIDCKCWSRAHFAAQCQCVNCSQPRSRLSCHPWGHKRHYLIWRVMPRLGPLELQNVERCPASMIQRHRGCHAGVVARKGATRFNVGLCSTKSLKQTEVSLQR